LGLRSAHSWEIVGPKGLACPLYENC
jgi:hypothetical protein